MMPPFKLLVPQVPGSFAADSYTDMHIGFAVCLSVRPQITIPEPVNRILSDIALGNFPKIIDIDCHRVETHL
jgi:hypothetical protein